MERLTDFSIERILAPDTGPPLPNLSGLWPGPLPVMVPVPVASGQPFTGSFGELLYARGAACFCGFDPSGMFINFSSAEALSPPASVCSGWFRPAGPSPPARPKVRARTLFTESQNKQLEALMAQDEYPTAETRSDIGRRLGLSDETVRIWFKNRRARRKRQRSNPLHGKPSPPLEAEPERSLFISFL